jgi:hypothetical protein
MNIDKLYDQVSDELQKYINRCDNILNIIQGKSKLYQAEIDLARELYIDLKGDLKIASSRGTILPKSERGEVFTEDAIYGTAVRGASIELRPKTNTHPINSKWFLAINSCKGELEDYLERLHKCKN